jgi:hypothetical protein
MRFDARERTAWINKSGGSLLQFCSHSGVVQLVAHGPLEPRILVRVQAPEPPFAFSELRESAEIPTDSKDAHGTT